MHVTCCDAMHSSCLRSLTPAAAEERAREGVRDCPPDLGCPICRGGFKPTAAWRYLEYSPVLTQTHSDGFTQARNLLQYITTPGGETQAHQLVSPASSIQDANGQPGQGMQQTSDLLIGDDQSSHSPQSETQPQPVRQTHKTQVSTSYGQRPIMTHGNGTTE